MMAKINSIFVQAQLQFVVVLLLISMGSCLQCYKCFNIDRHCYYGNTEYLSTLNCSENEVCAIFQYETDHSSVSHVTTIRGCQPIIKEGICSQLMKTRTSRKTVQRGILCNTCDTDLCNSAKTQNLSLFVVFVAMLLIIL